MSIGANLKQHRMSRGMTQAQLADAAGVTQPMINMIEMGSRVPNLIISKNIADALDIQIGQLLDDDSGSEAAEN